MNPKPVFPALALILLAFFCGCQGDGPPSVLDEITPYGESAYSVVSKQGSYKPDTINVSYVLANQLGDAPSERKFGCINLTGCPKEYYEKSDCGHTSWATFDDYGMVDDTLITSIPGTYTFEFCGIFEWNETQEDPVDLVEYAGDGDEVIVVVPPLNYKVRDKEGTYDDGEITVLYEVADENILPPKDGDRGCVNLTGYPEEFEDGDFGWTVYPEFDSWGIIRSILGTDVPGTYTFEFCGLQGLKYSNETKDLEWYDLPYSNDGDEIEVVIPAKMEVVVLNKNCTWWRPYPDSVSYAFECAWQLQFEEGWDGVCKTGIDGVRFKMMEDGKYETIWGDSSVTMYSIYCDDNTDVMTFKFRNARAGSSYEMSIHELDNENLYYDGDGDTQVVVIT